MTDDAHATAAGIPRQLGVVRIVAVGDDAAGGDLPLGVLAFDLPDDATPASLTRWVAPPPLTGGVRLLVPASLNLHAATGDPVRAVEPSVSLVLMRALIAAATRCPSGFDADQARLLGDALVELMRAALATPHRAGVGARREATLLERAIAHIDGQPDVDHDVERICAALHCSRSALYRAMRGAGGVAAVLRERRLAAAHARLVDPGETRTVSEIARASGFASAATFGRAYRRQFGTAPGAARERQRA